MPRRTSSEGVRGHEPRGLVVAMALYGPVTHDSRVLREAEALTRAGHSVTICCLSGAAPPGAPFRTLTHAPSRSRVMPDGTSPFLAASGSAPWKRLASRMRWVLGYSRNLRAWGRWAVVAAGDVDVWHAHDLTGLLAVGPSVRSPRRLVYDSHEIFLETGTAARLPMPLRRLLGTFEGFLARRAVALVTVNETYEEVLRRRLRPRRTVIVRNFPPRWFPPSPDHARLRDAAGVDEAQPLILYHGSFLPNRGIEQLAESILVPGLEAVHVALLGFGVLRPILEQMARDARFGGRLHVLDAVPPDELLDWVSGADAAVSLLQPTNEEHLLSTPNKLWESLAAGVPIIVSDFPVMRRIVLDDAIGQLGVTCDPTDPRSIATAIRDIVERPPGEREVLRSRCLRAAHEQWNWETESTRLVELYADIVPER